MAGEIEATREERLEAEFKLLDECAGITRRACEEMIGIIDSGKFGRDVAETQFGWLGTLRSRRTLIKSTIQFLNGTREDRTGRGMERGDAMK